MPALPSSLSFTDSSVTEGGFKTAISDLRGYLAFLLGEDGTKETAQLTLGAGFPSGTRMSFNQSSAPVGWTKDVTSALNDSLMRIVTGSVVNGGSVAFTTWNSSGTTGATTLTTAQMPSHSHVAQAGAYNSNVGQLNPVFGAGQQTTTRTIGAEGGGGSHSHTLSSDIKYYDFIIASKN